MSFFTTSFETTDHFGKAIEQCEKELQNVLPGSEEELSLLLKCAFCYAYVQLQKGEAIADAAIAIAEKRNDSISLAKALCVKAFNQYRIGYIRQSRETAEKALSLSTSLKYKEGIADAHWIMGTMMDVLEGTYEDQQFHQQQAMAAYRELGDATGIYLARIQEVSLPLFQFQLTGVIEDHEKLLIEIQETQLIHVQCFSYLELLRSLLMKRDIATLKARMEEWKCLAEDKGNFHDYSLSRTILIECNRMQQLNDSVMMECIECIACCEKLGSLHGQTTIHLILSNICIEQAHHTEAINYYQIADAIAMKIGARDKHLYALNGIGSALLKTGDYANAQKVFEKVLSEAPPKDKFNLMTAHRHLAELAIARMDFVLALQSFKHLLLAGGGDGLMAQDYGRYARCIGKASGEDLHLLGMTPGERKQLQLHYLQLYLEQSQKQQMAQEVANAHYEFAGYYEQHNDLKQALEHYRQYMLLQEEARNKENIQAMAALRMQYESEKKDREIQMLKKEKTTVLLQERLRISRDLHDDIGATLSSFSILSAIAGRHVEQQQLHEAKILMDRISNDAGEMIYNVSDLVWMINPKNDRMEKLMERIYSYANQMLGSKNVLLRFKGDELLYSILPSIEARKNIYLIMKEAINNTAKYADCNEAIISFLRDNGNLECRVTDNGKGFDLNTKYNGNGLRNMKERAAALKGSFNITSSLGKGTEINLITSISTIESTV